MQPIQTDCFVNFVQQQT